MMPIQRSAPGLACALLALASLAEENRDYKSEDWYDAELYPDAPFVRDSGFSQKPIQGKVLRIKRPLVIVSNLERSLDFYVDVVGLEVYEIAPYYNRDPKSLGYKLFDVPVGARKRMATLNTSDEVRGLTIQEIKDMAFEFNNKTPGVYHPVRNR